MSQDQIPFIEDDYIDKEKKPPFNCLDIFMQNPVVSVNECTGRAVLPPENAEEAESLTDIYGVPSTASEDNSGQHYKKAR